MLKGRFLISFEIVLEIKSWHMIALDPAKRDEEYSMFPADILEILVRTIQKYNRTNR